MDLSKLKDLIKVHIDFSKLKEIHLLSDNKAPNITYNDNRVIINVDPSVQTPEILKSLSHVIPQVLNEKGGLVIEDGSKKLLDNYSVIYKRGKYKDLLDYFKGKLSAHDLEILRASLYIREAFEDHQSVSDLKNDLVARYGTRGNNICNLCSAGYFETLIKPLYEQMLNESDFTPEKFYARYEVIILQIPFAVFVSHANTPEELVSLIISKIEYNRKYGVHRLYIHGIGETNVKKIKEILGMIKTHFIEEPEVDSSHGYINVTIHY